MLFGNVALPLGSYKWSILFAFLPSLCHLIPVIAIEPVYRNIWMVKIVICQLEENFILVKWVKVEWSSLYIFHPVLVNIQNFNTMKNKGTRRRLRESMFGSRKMVAIVSVSHRNKGREFLKIYSRLAFQVLSCHQHR